MHVSANKPAFKDPIRELFIYAVLNKYDDMSRLLWEQGQETIAAALAASKMLKGIHKAYRTRDADLKEEIMNLARYGLDQGKDGKDLREGWA